MDPGSNQAPITERGPTAEVIHEPPTPGTVPELPIVDAEAPPLRSTSPPAPEEPPAEVPADSADHRPERPPGPASATDRPASPLTEPDPATFLLSDLGYSVLGLVFEKIPSDELDCLVLTSPSIAALVLASGPEGLEVQSPSRLFGQLAWMAARRDAVSDIREGGYLAVECPLAQLPLLRGLQARIAEYEPQDAHAVLSRDLTLLQPLEGATSLDLRGCDRLHSVGALETLRALRKLNLGYCPNLADITGISTLDRLELLDLQSNPKIDDRDLHVIGRLRSLRSLNLDGCPIVGEGLVHLSSCHNLTHLGVSDCPKLANKGVEVLCQHLSGIRDLGMASASKVTDDGLSHLSSLWNLEVLNISYCYQLSDHGLLVLSSLRALRVLRMAGLHVTNPTPILHRARYHAGDLPSPAAASAATDHQYRGEGGPSGAGAGGAGGAAPRASFESDSALGGHDFEGRHGYARESGYQRLAELDIRACSRLINQQTVADLRGAVDRLTL